MFGNGAGGTLYTVGYNDAVLYRVNPLTGQFTPVGYSGIFSLMDLSFDAGGTLWGTVGNNLYTISTTTGAGTFRTSVSGPGLTSGEIMGIAFSANNTLFATTWESVSSLYSVNTTTGAASKIADLSGSTFVHGGDIFIPQQQAVPLPAVAWAGMALLGGIAGRRGRR